MLFGFIVLAACSSAPADTHSSIASPAPAFAQNATLLRVIDGDTIDVDLSGHKERVRLIGIDTPETVKPNTPVQCYGPEASAHTKSLLHKGDPLHLERDAEARDTYGRLLAYVYRADNGLFVNLEIITKGYAHVLTIAPNVAHVDEFVAAPYNPQRANLGRGGR